MLVIRQQQEEIFRSHQLEQAVYRAMGHVHEYYPNTSVEYGGQLLGVVLQAFTDGRNYGFVSMRDALKFLNLSIELGPGFHTSAPWADIIQDMSVTPTEKILLIRIGMKNGAGTQT